MPRFHPAPAADPSATVWVLGSLNADLTFTVPTIVRPGETLSAMSSSTAPGGKGMNQAVAAAHEGARTVMVGAVGDDSDGALLARTLEDRGVHSALLCRDQARTGTAMVQLDSTGENAIIVLPGANETLTPDETRAALAACQPGDVVVAQLEIPQDAIEAGFRAGHERGARTLLNAAPAADATELLPHVDVLVVNEGEARTLVGGHMDDAASRLRATHDCDVIVTLGAAGCMVVDSSGPEHVPAIATNVVDTTGAGDAFVGAVAAALAEGTSLRDAVSRGTELASHVCSVAGAQGY